MQRPTVSPFTQRSPDAAQLLGWRSLTVIKGGGGEFERHPGKDIAAFGLRNGQPWQQAFPALSDETRRLKEDATDGDFETAIVAGTAALAFETLGQPPLAGAAE